MTTHSIVRVPIESLPDDDLQRCSTLDEYFRDLLPTASLANNHWEILLERPSDAIIYIDPNLSTGLEWWGGLQVSRVFSAFKRCRGFFLSLHDCWSLLSWSEWMQRTIQRNGQAPGNVTILHVDDHTDLMSPLLVSSGKHLEDMITSDIVRLSEPESVSHAVQSGAIGVGSFIAPFLHEFERATFLHLVKPTRRHPKDVASSLYATHTLDTLLRPQGCRPALGIEESIPSERGGRKLGQYIKATRLASLLEHHDGGPILLHIDMDFCNNRFDGDSDWQRKDGRHDPPTEDVLASIAELFESLASSPASSDVEDITIALSPGFFPAELWKPSIESVERNLDPFGLQFSLDRSEGK